MLSEVELTQVKNIIIDDLLEGVTDETYWILTERVLDNLNKRGLLKSKDRIPNIDIVISIIEANPEVRDRDLVPLVIEALPHSAHNGQPITIPAARVYLTLAKKKIRKKEEIHQ